MFGDLDVRLEPWEVEYGTELPLQTSQETNDEDVGLDIEVPESSWKAITPVRPTPVERLFFVDGVRRIEARLIVQREGKLSRGAFGSYGVGSVLVSDGKAEIGDVRSGRLVVIGSGEKLAEPVEVMPHLTYYPESTESPDADAPLRVIQENMRLEEERLGRQKADQPDSLVVLDGPLTFGERVRGQAVGYVKRLHRLYIDQGSRTPRALDLLSRLPSGARTPLFAIRPSKRFARYSWFLRLLMPHPASLRCRESFASKYPMWWGSRRQNGWPTPLH